MDRGSINRKLELIMITAKTLLRLHACRAGLCLHPTSSYQAEMVIVMQQRGYDNEVRRAPVALLPEMDLDALIEPVLVVFESRIHEGGRHAGAQS